MATMSQTWSILIAITVLAVQLCIGEKSCAIWSSDGPVVLRGSTFKVYCTFNCRCKGSMYSDHPPTLQNHQELNSTTIYLSVVNITKNRTYSCHCTCSALDPCGLDISAGYPPDDPKNISCIYKVINNKRKVTCTWNRGRDTYLWNSSELWVRTVSGNHTDRPDSYTVSIKGTALPTATFSVSSSVQLISVWVKAQNPLGPAESKPINYTLSDIEMPSTPVLGQPECYSRKCIIKVQSERIEHLEIQYRADAQKWTSLTDSDLQNGQVWSISSLDPYQLYHFRARSKFTTGLWSQWSTNVSSWTQEEAPAKELDVWWAESASDFTSLRVYWKEANISNARGKIIEYNVSVYSHISGLVFSTNISADARNCLVPFCASCEVTVCARNSKGISPPATITTHHTKAKPQQDVYVTVDNHTISWRKPETAPLPAGYVVEWYTKGHKLEELRWLRLGRNDNHAVITGIKPFECYDGAVYVLYNDRSVSRNRFTGVTTLESVPAAGPSVQEKVEGNKVKVTWTDIPRRLRGGCITKYTIYLKNSSGHVQPYSILASERLHIIEDLPPAVYRLWMTASTAQGEGPACPELPVFIQQETSIYAAEPKRSLLLGFVVFTMIGLFLLCLCQSSAVKQRFWVFFQCLMLDVVPDPANSKWAKACTQEKGKMNLLLQPNNSSVNEEEEEPILVDVEELPKQSSDICTPRNVSSQLLPQTSLGPLTEPATVVYPLTTYIKSFSHDSDSSDHTQTSLETNTTVDYISSHGPENIEEDQEDDDDDDEEEFLEMPGFFHSHNIFFESLDFGGKLTLDAVKIECKDLFQNS